MLVKTTIRLSVIEVREAIAKYLDNFGLECDSEKDTVLITFHTDDESKEFFVGVEITAAR